MHHSHFQSTIFSLHWQLPTVHLHQTHTHRNFGPSYQRPPNLTLKYGFDWFYLDLHLSTAQHFDLLHLHHHNYFHNHQLGHCVLHLKPFMLSNPLPLRLDDPPLHSHHTDHQLHLPSSHLHLHHRPLHHLVVTNP